VTADRVKVPGAELYCEVAGHGPALLLIAGGGGDAGMYEEVVPKLAQRFTVLTYDRRGNSRSHFTDADPDIGIAAQMGDAVAVLDHHGMDRAHIFGSSGGALIALDLLARHPTRVASLVAHEPPLMSLLPDDSPERRELVSIFDLAKRSPLRAYAAFGAMIMTNPPWLFRSQLGQATIAGATRVALLVGAAWRRLTGRQPDSMTRQLGNADLLLRRELPVIAFEYEADEQALRSVDVPWCLAVGQESAGKPYHRPALVLSQRLGVPCEVFPGGHTLYVEDPAAFADALLNVLEGLSE